MKKISKVSNNLTIGLIGSLDVSYKGFDTAIKALSLLKNLNKIFRLEVVGGGNPHKIEKLAIKYKVREQIFFKGTLPYPDGIFQWLDSLDIYIQPSKVEGLPRSLIEAMSRGCPSFASRVGGISELLPPSVLHNKNDYKKLAELLYDFTSFEKLRDHAIHCFNKSEEYDKNKLDQRRTEFYRNCIAEVNP